MGLVNIIKICLSRGGGKNQKGKPLGEKGNFFQCLVRRCFAAKTFNFGERRRRRNLRWLACKAIIKLSKFLQVAVSFPSDVPPELALPSNLPAYHEFLPAHNCSRSTVFLSSFPGFNELSVRDFRDVGQAGGRTGSRAAGQTQADVSGWEKVCPTYMWSYLVTGTFFFSGIYLEASSPTDL